MGEFNIVRILLYKSKKKTSRERKDCKSEPFWLWMRCSCPSSREAKLGKELGANLGCTEQAPLQTTTVQDSFYKIDRCAVLKYL